MRICLVLEGCYPYVHGGVSTWMHSYITAMKEHEFVLWVIGAKAKDRGKFVYDLPSNVVEVHEVFLDDALRLSGEHAKVIFTDEEVKALRELVNLSDPDWDVLFNLFHNKGVHPLSFLQSNEFIDLFTKICMEEYPYVAYADAFHTVRSMLLPVLYLMTGEVPKAQIYHAISALARPRSTWALRQANAWSFPTASNTNGSATFHSSLRTVGWISAPWYVWLPSRT